MAFNKNKFVSVIKANGDTQSKLAKVLSISPGRLSAKINHKGGADFTRKEIENYCQYYKLEPDEIVSIFFAPNIS